MSRTILAGLCAALAVAPAAGAIPSQQSVRAPGNVAGVQFHPYGDYFEIWDNMRDGKPAWVKWNYVGIDDGWKTVTQRGGHGRHRVNMAEYPHQIYFRVIGFNSERELSGSPTIRYRTWGT